MFICTKFNCTNIYRGKYNNPFEQIFCWICSFNCTNIYRRKKISPLEQFFYWIYSFSIKVNCTCPGKNFAEIPGNHSWESAEIPRNLSQEKSWQQFWGIFRNPFQGISYNQVWWISCNPFWGISLLSKEFLVTNSREFPVTNSTKITGENVDKICGSSWEFPEKSSSEPIPGNFYSQDFLKSSSGISWHILSIFLSTFTNQDFDPTVVNNLTTIFIAPPTY